jgi:DNA-binding MarR family transcriptional regulator
MDPDLPAIARSLSSEVGPFRRTLMNATRRAGALPDIPDAQVEVMRRLDADGWASPTALGRSLGLARSTVSNLILAMERDDLVERRLVRGDGRSTEVGLTDHARELLRTYDHAAEEVLVSALRRLPASARRDIAAAVPALQDLRAAIGGRTGTP